MAQVRQLMLKSNNQVGFSFQTYQTVDMPVEWANSLQSLAAVVRQDVKSKMEPFGPIQDLDDDWLVCNSYADGSAKPYVKYPKRSRLSRPNGFRSPLGAAGKRLSFEELGKSISCHVQVRSPAKNKDLYGERDHFSADRDRVHWGMDIAVDRRADIEVYAVRPGRVSVVRRSTDGPANVWKFFDLRNNKVRTVDGTASGRYDKWSATIKSQFGENGPLPTSDKIQLSNGWVSLQVAGSYLTDIEDPNIIYFTEMKGGGQYIRIDHEGKPEAGEDPFDGDFSQYMHLSEIYVNVPDTITAANIDQPIGKIGQTDVYSEEFLTWYFHNKKQANPGSSNHNFNRLDPYEYSWTHNEAENKFAAGKRAPEASGGYALATHLHFEYWEKEASGPPIDMKYEGSPQKIWGTFSHCVPVDCAKSWAMASDKTSTTLHIALPPTTNALTEEVVAKKLQTDLGKDYKLDLDKVKDAVEVMQILSEDGYYHYEGSLRLPNVWYKTWVLNFPHNENDDSLFTPDTNVIVTGLSAGFTNIVAKLPILGYEYPTLQHMGAIEPNYSFEFSILDDVPNLQGLSQGGVLLEGMRSVLQRNARIYREIRDSWGVSTDTFVTRLFGSYRPTDAEYNIEGGIVGQVKLLRRTVIDRADAGTVEGNRSLLCIL
jgi:murein DD-endopeptidase MepM/ murein hydrolase activator NlpD